MKAKNTKKIDSVKRKKLGLALGGGAARGLSHIGVLKVLLKHGIKPDYIAGTSMGSIISAMYAAGYSPIEIQKIARTTNWQNLFDFTVPKKGLIQGKIMERKLRQLLENKKFKDLRLKTGIVAYNLTQREQVVFTKGDLTTAVTASIAIPGIFNPVRINGDDYLDGGLSNPTPYDVVKEMGADVVLAVDLLTKEKKVKKKEIHRKRFVDELKKKFVIAELLNAENYLFPQRWPRFIRKTLQWAFKKILYPAKVFKIMAGRKLPEITKIMYESIDCLSNNLAYQRMKNAPIKFKIMLAFSDLTWTDFDQVDRFVKIGEKAMQKEIVRLKRELKKT